MSDPARLAEDKALRDAARALVDGDIARVRSAIEQRSIPARAMDRAAEGAADVLEQVSTAAAQHKGLIAGVIGAAALWLARHPLMRLLDDRDPDDLASPSPQSEDVSDDRD